MRVYTALIDSTGSTDDAELFATLTAEAGQDLDGGFEELTAGLLQIIALLTHLLAERSDVPRAQVVRAVGVALASH
ncbi:MULTISPECIES: hypothetical protein [unclassified Nocardioides]|uniref:hypothetical protein n=1 Tax=unclassified Nocardioides TaxID=2615069 RepID=UPI0009F00590|nr:MULTISPECIES: hypothetical protein [unclassified Nocardioides]GAW47954.1 Heavy metal translocating P-type ATPase [Nocardioides sp. PD653-B2]GAW53743.1 Heavy metal translocating P-type ATPase [Nocardioides sp. PD653]